MFNSFYFFIQDDADFKRKQKEQEKALKEAREKAAKGPLGLLFK